MTTQIEIGDYVRDPLDDNTLRQVIDIDGNTLYMDDGGVMGADEAEEVLLPSEVE